MHTTWVEFWIEIQFKFNLLNELNSNILNGTQISLSEIQVPLNSWNSIEEKRRCNSMQQVLKICFSFTSFATKLWGNKKKKVFHLCDLWLCCMIEGNFENIQIQKNIFQCFKTIMGKAN